MKHHLKFQKTKTLKKLESKMAKIFQYSIRIKYNETSN